MRRYRKYTDREVVEEAKAFLRTPGGVSAVAELLGMPRSTLHYHIAIRLSWVDIQLWWEVRKMLAYNKHHHGGRR